MCRGQCRRGVFACAKLQSTLLAEMCIRSKACPDRAAQDEPDEAHCHCHALPGLPAWIFTHFFPTHLTLYFTAVFVHDVCVSFVSIFIDAGPGLG